MIDSSLYLKVFRTFAMVSSAITTYTILEEEWTNGL